MNDIRRQETIALDRIKDGGAQMRIERLRAETVTEYARDMLAGAVFPAVVVFDDGTNCWLADGFHRVAAARKIERAEILADIRPGMQRDAILHAVGSNATHGLRRSRDDVRQAIIKMLSDAEWGRMSDRRIADTVRCDHKTVGAVRRELTGEFPTTKAAAAKRTSGEFPTHTSGHAKPIAGSLVADTLRHVSDADLIAECWRRGFEVGGGRS